MPTRRNVRISVRMFGIFVSCFWITLVLVAVVALIWWLT